MARRIDSMHIALGTGSAVNLRRIGLLCDPAYTGLNRFLAADDSGQSGVMMLEYVAAAAVGRIRINSQPASLQTVVLSLGAEEDASFATLAAAQLESTADALSKLVAIELICAIRALRLQGTEAQQLYPERIRKILEVAQALPDSIQDRDLRDDLALAENIVLTAQE